MPGCKAGKWVEISVFGDYSTQPLRSSYLFETAAMGFMRFVGAAATGAFFLGLVQPQGLVADAQGQKAATDTSCSLARLLAHLFWYSFILHEFTSSVEVYGCVHNQGWPPCFMRTAVEVATETRTTKTRTLAWDIVREWFRISSIVLTQQQLE